ncbi:hypothetical protein B0H14DRAFT_2574720 [Mycena olivaceomarginata]|nr:hypothetical protein B0H14DRAFT_2574720 [Mycena olivaceomarginata]
MLVVLATRRVRSAQKSGLVGVIPFEIASSWVLCWIFGVDKVEGEKPNLLTTVVASNPVRNHVQLGPGLDVQVAVDASFVPSSTSTQRSLGTMARPKRPKRKEQVPALSSAERRRKADTKYRVKPEVREKNRHRMAEKRAAVKMRRRQWDPPKPAKDDADDAEGSLTPAEHVALAVLTGMRHNQNSDPATLLDSDSDIESSAVPEQGLRYVTPETPLQKRMRRELGTIGPLTPVQVAQIKTVKLARPSRRYHEEGEQSDVTQGTNGPFLSSARRERIWEWMGNLREFADWDSSVRRELEQDSLQRRKLFHHQYQ